MASSRLSASLLLQMLLIAKISGNILAFWANGKVKKEMMSLFVASPAQTLTQKPRFSARRVSPTSWMRLRGFSTAFVALLLFRNLKKKKKAASERAHLTLQDV